MVRRRFPRVGCRGKHRIGLGSGILLPAFSAKRVSWRGSRVKTNVGEWGTRESFGDRCDGSLCAL